MGHRHKEAQVSKKKRMFNPSREETSLQVLGGPQGTPGDSRKHCPERPRCSEQNRGPAGSGSVAGRKDGRWWQTQESPGSPQGPAVGRTPRAVLPQPAPPRTLSLLLVSLSTSCRWFLPGGLARLLVPSYLRVELWRGPESRLTAPTW